ncbi:MAG TPA: cation transporter, partial [Clostridia bacterium]|nr:cation transporter [Clostridia bacterium]
MEEKLTRKVLHIDGMTCTSCEMRIENALNRLDGMINAKAIYSSSNVYVTYDENRLGPDKIIDAIEKLDYKVINGADVADANHAEKESNGSVKNENKMGIGQLIGIAIIILALYIIVKNTVGFNFIPQVDQSMGYGILFAVGLLTSLHCIAMCGGINMSVCMKYKADYRPAKFSMLKPSALYNLGRVLSYT